MSENSTPNISDFYTSIEDAVSVLNSNLSLRTRLESEIKLKGSISSLLQKKHIVMFRQVATPINEVIRVHHIAKMYDLPFMIIEYSEDKFTPSINVYKYNLAKLPIYNGDVNKISQKIVHKINIVDFAKMEGKTLSSVMTLNKEYLVDIHHELFDEVIPNNHTTIRIDASDWLLTFSGAKDYYKMFFKLFLCHNILAEVYLEEGNETSFTNKVIVPILQNIKNEYGIKPLIWNYLDGTPPEMKYYWDCYPKKVGELLNSKGYY